MHRIIPLCTCALAVIACASPVPERADAPLPIEDAPDGTIDTQQIDIQLVDADLVDTEQIDAEQADTELVDSASADSATSEPDAAPEQVGDTTSWPPDPDTVWPGFGDDAVDWPDAKAVVDAAQPPTDAGDVAELPDGATGALSFDDAWTAWLADTASGPSGDPTACAAAFDTAVAPPPLAPALPAGAFSGLLWTDLPACPGPVTATTTGDGTTLEDGSLGCSTCCGPLPNAESWQCAYGACVVRRCKPGFQDRNGRGEDGCEAAEPVTCQVYVAAANAADPKQDGSAAHPFASFAAGLAKAAPGCTVHVAAGTYAGTLTVATPSILLRGAGSNTVVQAQSTLDKNQTAPNLPIAADKVVVEGMRFVGGPAGVRVDKHYQVVLRDVEVSNVKPLTDPDWFGNCAGESACVGVHVVDASAAVLALVRVTGVHGGTCDGSSTTSTLCRAVELTGGQGTRIVGLDVGAVQGISAVPCKSQYGCAPGQESFGQGGNAAAVAFRGGAKNHSLLAARLSPPSGGESLQAKDFKSYTVTDYPPGAGYGLFLDATSLGQKVGTRVRYGSDPVVYLHGVQGVAVHGVEIKSQLRQTNLGTIVVVASKDVTVSGCKITASTNQLPPVQPTIAMLGCPGCRAIGNQVALKGTKVATAAIFVTGGAGAVISGNQLSHIGGNAIAVLGCPGCKGALVHANQLADLALWTSAEKSFQWSSVSKVTPMLVWDSPGACVVANKASGAKGKDGEDLAPSGPPDQSPSGTSLAGIAVFGSAGAVVAGNVVGQIQAGESGSWQTSTSQWSGWAGEASGLLLVGSPGAWLADNVVHGVRGGAAAHYEQSESSAPGHAHGVRVVQSAGAILTRNLVYDVVAGVASPPGDPIFGPPWGRSVCVRVDASTGVSIGRQTCHLQAPETIGIAATTSQVLVHDGIVVGATGCCAEAGYGQSAVAFAWSDIVCGACPTGVAMGPGVYSADPAFVSPGTGDFAVVCSATTCSPTVDTGNPAQAWCLEPSPNGCRSNLGHTGGTSKAASKPGATHCGCP